MTDQVKIGIITAEEVAARERVEQTGREIIKGEWADDTTMAGKRHGTIILNLTLHLAPFIKAKGLGKLYPDNVNYVLKGTRQHIEVMRIPDLSFVKVGRVDTADPGYYYLAPDIAIEVVLPSELPSDTDDKVKDYLHYGTAEVWVIYPDEQHMVVYHADGSTTPYRAEDKLISSLLPGFEMAVLAMFEE